MAVVLRKVQIAVVEFQRWGRLKMVKTGGEAQMGQDNIEVGAVELCTDGSMIPGSNAIGGGGVVCDREGRWLSGFAGSYGVGDAFLAEARALLEGMQHVCDLGYRSMVFFSDCAELVDVVTRTGDVNQFWHQDMIQQIRELLHRSWSASVRGIPRERNMVADALAKYATRVSCSWRVWRLPLALVVSLLCQDVLD